MATLLFIDKNKFSQFIILVGYLLSDYVGMCCSQDQYTDFDGSCQNSCSSTVDTSFRSKCNSTDCIDLLQNNCISCTDGFYSNANLTCTACTSTLNCATCKSDTSCITCKTQFYLLGDQCLQTCGDGYYSNNTNFTCEACSISNCQHCSTSQSICEQCMDGYYLTSNGTCMSCNSSLNCKSCLDQNTCNSCFIDSIYSYLSKGICKTTCESNQYVGNNKVCIDCDSKQNCLTCNSQGCLTCAPTNYIEDKYCVATCSDGYYLDSLSSTCLLCNTSLNCKTCQDDGQKCHSCSQSSSQKYLQNNECVTQCSQQFYLDSSQNPICLPCNPDYNCLTCMNQYSCSTCNQFGLKKYLNNNKCVTTCDIGQYSDKFTCMSCLPTCQTCNSGKDCASCNSGSTYKYLKENQCVQSCGYGFFVDDKNNCIPCQSSLNCKTCTSTISQCDSCFQGLDPSENQQGTLYKYLYNGQCVVSCYDLNSFPDKQNTCQLCLPNCYSCSSVKVCDVCQSLSRKGDDGQCYKCSSGEIVTEDGKYCISQQLCSLSLQYVISIDQTKCIQKQTCLDSSPLNYITQNGDLQQCSVCPKPNVLSSNRNTCSQTCPPGEIQSIDTTSNYCVACESNMITNLEKTKCISQNLCIEPYIISELQQACILKQTCLNSDNNYIIRSNGLQICKTCSNYVISNDKSQCLDKCPEGQYQVTNTKTCQICNGQSSQSICSCKMFIDISGNCVEQCPKGQYINPNKNTQICSICHGVLSSDGNQCNSYCPIGQYLNSPSSKQCLVCNEFITSNGFGCVKVCPKITDIDKRICLQDQMFCENYLSEDGKICSQFCLNDEALIQNQNQCTSSCQKNYIRDMRENKNMCIPTQLCLSYISSDKQKCIQDCSDNLETNIKNSNQCVQPCNSQQIKILENDLSISCIEANDTELYSQVLKSLVNFQLHISNFDLIGLEQRGIYITGVQQYTNTLQIIIDSEYSSSLPTFYHSQQILNQLLNITYLINSKTYNNEGLLLTLNNTNIIINSYILKRNELISTTLSLNHFINPQFISTDISIFSNILQYQTIYLKQNIFCQQLCSDSSEFFSVVLNINQSQNRRILQSTQNFNLTFNISKEKNISFYTCISIISNIQIPAINTIKNIDEYTITCTFQQNVFLVLDSNCLYQNHANCVSQTQNTITKNVDGDVFSQWAVAGIIIGIVVMVLMIGSIALWVKQRKKVKVIEKQQLDVILEQKRPHETNQQEDCVSIQI